MYKKKYDKSRRCWNVLDSRGKYICSFNSDWEAQGHCNKKNEEKKVDAKSTEKKGK